MMVNVDETVSMRKREMYETPLKCYCTPARFGIMTRCLQSYPEPHRSVLLVVHLRVCFTNNRTKTGSCAAFTPVFDDLCEPFFFRLHGIVYNYHFNTGLSEIANRCDPRQCNRTAKNPYTTARPQSRDIRYHHPQVGGTSGSNIF